MRTEYLWIVSKEEIIGLAKNFIRDFPEDMEKNRTNFLANPIL